MSTTFPLRSYSFGDASASYKGRSGTQEIGAILSHDGQPDVKVTRQLDGSIRVITEAQVGGHWQTITLYEGKVTTDLFVRTSDPRAAFFIERGVQPDDAPAVVELIVSERAVDAIKQIRRSTGLGLKEAKNIYDVYKVKFGRLNP